MFSIGHNVCNLHVVCHHLIQNVPIEVQFKTTATQPSTQLGVMDDFNTFNWNSQLCYKLEWIQLILKYFIFSLICFFRALLALLNSHLTNNISFCLNFKIKKWFKPFFKFWTSTGMWSLRWDWFLVFELVLVHCEIND